MTWLIKPYEHQTWCNLILWFYFKVIDELEDDLDNMELDDIDTTDVNLDDDFLDD